MNKIIFLKGLPGSGKSTWRKEFNKANPMVLYTNKDEIRNETRIQLGMQAGTWNKDLEQKVEQIEFNMVRDYLENGYDVIIDNTHLDPRHEEKYRKLASRGHWDFEVKFFDIPLDECLRRNALREGQARVPDKVIRDMYKKWLKPKPVAPPAHIPEADWAVIVDMDGTLALFEGNPYDRDFENDKVNIPVKWVVNNLYTDNMKVIITSGRNGKFRRVTEEWLLTNSVFYDILLMRDEKDNRKDSEVKLDFYNQEIKGKYNVFVVLDDRNQVVSLWRSLGLNCWQVAEGDF